MKIQPLSKVSDPNSSSAQIRISCIKCLNHATYIEACNKEWQMIIDGIPFHDYICPDCLKIPFES